jgi:hypothetical protein
MLTITNQGFLTSPQLLRSVRDNIQSILNDVNIQPVWHPMHEGFDCIVIKQAEDILQRIIALDANTNELRPEYWSEIATITPEGGLVYMAKMIQTIVLPRIIETREESKLMRNLERGSQHQQKLERDMAEAYRGSDPDLKLDSTFVANG